jgi:very-short-patch-repair endonuclease
MIRGIATAVAGGCESAGEVYVWHLLGSLGVRFHAQREINVGVDAKAAIGSHLIRVDFIIEGDVILEVDSALHQHLKDVRRDLWNLTAGRRTLRIVGTDVISDPVRAQEQLAQALKHLGIRVNPQPLPAWLTAQ